MVNNGRVKRLKALIYCSIVLLLLAPFILLIVSLRILFTLGSVENTMQDAASRIETAAVSLESSVKRAEISLDAGPMVPAGEKSGSSIPPEAAASSSATVESSAPPSSRSESSLSESSQAASSEPAADSSVPTSSLPVRPPEAATSLPPTAEQSGQSDSSIPTVIYPPVTGK